MKLKYILFLLIFGLTYIPFSYAQPDALWEKANKLYEEGKYEEATQQYLSLINANITNATLYYNIANAYYKQKEIAPSVLYYERALKLSPHNKDILYNLAIAQQQVIDKTNALPTLFFITWMHNIRQLLTAKAWGYLSLALFAIVLALLLYVFAGSGRPFRKQVFIGAVFVFILTLTSLYVALSAQKYIQNHHEAIVFSPVATIKSSPDNHGTDLFVLHEGTKVQIIEIVNQWANIRIADGNQGWIPLEIIKTI